MGVHALYSAATGMNAQLKQLEVTANNVANLSTHGFKRDRVNFADLFYRHQHLVGATGPNGTTRPTGVHFGNGVEVVSTQKFFEAGGVMMTGNPLDVAIQGPENVFFKVQTPDGSVRYEGDTAIDGVPGTAAPVQLNFLDVAGINCGSMLPTGNAVDVINDVEVSCVDVAMPIMIARAADLCLTGYETCEEIDANKSFYQRVEAMRLQAGELMGLGDVREKVMPKIALLAPPQGDALISARYLMPWNCHPTLAVTGAQCIASCAMIPGTVAEGLAVRPQASPASVYIEHPSGRIEVLIDYAMDGGEFRLHSAGLTRTARLIARGELMVPASVKEPAN